MDKASVWRQLHHHHHQQQQQQSNGGEGRVVGGGGNAVAVAAGATAASPPCRPTGARWTPTPEQVKILKELYYGCGIRSPNPEQIQRIAARLRQYGRIEGKNVFYWFQNHKARERHKKRLGVVVNACSGDPTHLGVISPGSACSGAAPAASSYGFGNGGTAVQMDGSTTTSCWGDSAAAMGATERSSYVQLQDYMGVTRSTGAGNQGAAPSPWPACLSYSSNQTPSQMLPPAMLPPETLPLFPTGGRHGGGEEEGSVDVAHNSYPQSNSNFHWWGAAGANTTTTTTMTFQQQHHHQLQQQQLQDQQYSYYSSSSNQQQLMMPTSQDAGTSLELTLSSSPYYPARFM